MATFPQLKTGGVAQYPLRRSIRQRVDAVAFLDGSEQRCAITRPLRAWVVRLDLLDEQEMNTLKTFIDEEQGACGRFQFTDPADGILYPSCSLDADSCDYKLVSQGRARTELTIRENPD